jgi:CRISPR-associated endonuclease/helicase Cas3
LEQKRHLLEPIDGDIFSKIDLIAKAAEEKAQSTLVVCNHVPTAQVVYMELVNKVKDTVLLHSQFTRRDRNEIENDLLRSKLPQEHRLYKKLPKILVSTQVVEVSLDLDFEQGFTEPAPIDAIIQRLGRINRFASRPPAQVGIFSKQAHSYKIYDKDLTAKSLRELSGLPRPLGEDELNHAADRVYGKGYSTDNQEKYEAGLNYLPLKKFRKYLVAGTDQNWIGEVIDENEGSLDLLPEPLVDEYNKLKNEGLTIEANNILVPVGKWRGRYLFDEKRIDTSQDPWTLLDCKYSKEIGLEI